MATKIKTLRLGITHAISGCHACDFYDAYDGKNGSLSVDKLRSNAKKHTRVTGHTTYVETGAVTTYQAN